jgi:hypothetical protein
VFAGLLTHADDPPPVTTTVTTTVAETVNGRDVHRVWSMYQQADRDRDKRGRTIVRLKRAWRPTVEYALLLASRVSGVALEHLRTVARCESTLNPAAENGKYKGLMQLGWAPFGFSPYDPVANALSAALTVRHEGSWKRWDCKP